MPDKSRKKVGIMGGTFDPIHTGHLILGEVAREQFALDKILFMPTGNPPHKHLGTGRGSNEQRTEMVRRAIEGNPGFELSLVEMEREGLIYTSDTLALLRESDPDTDYYFILGADSLFSFHTWHEPQRICDQCVILAAVRDNVSGKQMEDQIKLIADRYHADVRLLATPNIDISSSQIRTDIAQGKSCRYYLPESVRIYIIEEGLYQPVPSCSGLAESARN